MLWNDGALLYSGVWPGSVVSRAGPMAAGEATGVDLSRKFVTEAELDEKRKKRQEEWEKVRKPDDPEGW